MFLVPLLGARAVDLPLPPTFHALLRVFEALDTVITLTKRRGRIGIGSLGAGGIGACKQPLLTLSSVKESVESMSAHSFSPAIFATIAAVAPHAFLYMAAYCRPDGMVLEPGRLGGSWHVAVDINGTWSAPAGQVADDVARAPQTGALPMTATERRRAFHFALLRIFDEAHAQYLQKNKLNAEQVAAAWSGLDAAEDGGLLQHVPAQKRARHNSVGGAEGSAHTSAPSSTPGWHPDFDMSNARLPPPIVLPGGNSYVAAGGMSASAAAGAGADLNVGSESAGASAGVIATSATTAGANAITSSVVSAGPIDDADKVSMKESDDALIESVIRANPSLRGMRREILLKMAAQSSKDTAGGRREIVGGRAAILTQGAQLAVTHARLAGIALRVLDAVVGAMRVPAPARTKVFLDDICARAYNHLRMSSSMSVSAADVEGVLELLASTIAPHWCTIISLCEEPAESPAATRRVFRLTTAGEKGFKGSCEGAVSVEDVRKTLDAWCCSQAGK